MSRSEDKIQRLRSRLYATIASAEGDLTNEGVLRRSEALDVAINQAMAQMGKTTGEPRVKHRPKDRRT